MVKTINLLGEFCLAYRLSSEAWEYILELVNKFAMHNACFSSHFLVSFSLTLAASANFEIAA